MVIQNGMGSNPLWLVEWLTAAMDLKPGMRVLDLGCGRGLTSIFLAREFGVAEPGDKIGVTAGLPSLTSGGTNLFKVHTVR